MMLCQETEGNMSALCYSHWVAKLPPRHKSRTCGASQRELINTTHHPLSLNSRTLLRDMPRILLREVRPSSKSIRRWLIWLIWAHERILPVISVLQLESKRRLPPINRYQGVGCLVSGINLHVVWSVTGGEAHRDLISSLGSRQALQLFITPPFGDHSTYAIHEGKVPFDSSSILSRQWGYGFMMSREIRKIRFVCTLIRTQHQLASDVCYVVLWLREDDHVVVVRSHVIHRSTW